MIRGEYQSVYRKHTSGLMITGIADTVQHALDTFGKSQVQWEQWATTPVRHQAAMDLFRELASSDKLRVDLQDQYLRERDTRGDNLWAVYSALTYYASHSDDNEFKMRRSVEQQDSSAFIMMKRELSVAKWIDSDAWHALEET
jgi:hypothetical protein